MESIGSLTSRMVALEWLLKQTLAESFNRHECAQTTARYFAADADWHWSQEADAALERGDMEAWTQALRIRREVIACMSDIIQRLET
ncbi:hypothetical protein [Aureimonas sp. D3]|uniref:hypothetical protein n=1 Tax=Aureimonas sp. D3 TaxID=1638164 RepID=UPI000A6D9A30|nr:hypothetical protein [Aureimonas sp. D3]